MVTIPDLWIPIALATALTFFAGFVLHMLLPLHKGEWSQLPDEADLLTGLRAAKLRPGMYMFPYPASMKEMGTPEFMARWRLGPVGAMIVRPSEKFGMGPQLTKMLVYHLVVSVVVAYLAGRTLPASANYYEVFRVAGTAGVLGYISAVFPFAIWHGTSARHLTNQVIDGLVWGLVTAGSFAGFWPR